MWLKCYNRILFVPFVGICSRTSEIDIAEMGNYFDLLFAFVAKRPFYLNSASILRAIMYSRIGYWSSSKLNQQKKSRQSTWISAPNFTTFHPKLWHELWNAPPKTVKGANYVFSIIIATLGGNWCRLWLVAREKKMVSTCFQCFGMSDSKSSQKVGWKAEEVGAGIAN